VQRETLNASFPTSLAPVASAQRAENKNKKAFKGDGGQFIVNGVTLKVNSRNKHNH